MRRRCHCRAIPPREHRVRLRLRPCSWRAYGFDGLTRKSSHPFTMKNKSCPCWTGVNPPSVWKTVFQHLSLEIVNAASDLRTLAIILSMGLNERTRVGVLNKPGTVRSPKYHNLGTPSVICDLSNFSSYIERMPRIVGKKRLQYTQCIRYDHIKLHQDVKEIQIIVHTVKMYRLKD